MSRLRKRLIIAGSRSLHPSVPFINMLINCFDPEIWPELEEVVSGKAKGVDTRGERFAEKWELSVRPFPPDKEEHGVPACFPVRNSDMADYGDRLLLIWDGSSSGSQDMLEQMRLRGKPVWVYTNPPGKPCLTPPTGQFEKVNC